MEWIFHKIVVLFITSRWSLSPIQYLCDIVAGIFLPKLWDRWMLSFIWSFLINRKLSPNYRRLQELPQWLHFGSYWQQVEHDFHSLIRGMASALLRQTIRCTSILDHWVYLTPFCNNWQTNRPRLKNILLVIGKSFFLLTYALLRGKTVTANLLSSTHQYFEKP